jgi:hypothetical protein
LTAKELPARWRKSLSGIYLRKGRGQLPFYRLGGSIRLRLDDIDAYEAARSRDAGILPL